MGTEKQSLGSKRQWARLTLEQRKKRMKALSKARWVGVSDRKKRSHAKAMASARWAKES